MPQALNFLFDTHFPCSGTHTKNPLSLKATQQPAPLGGKKFCLTFFHRNEIGKQYNVRQLIHLLCSLCYTQQKPSNVQDFHMMHLLLDGVRQFPWRSWQRAKIQQHFNIDTSGLSQRVTALCLMLSSHREENPQLKHWKEKTIYGASKLTNWAPSLIIQLLFLSQHL